MPDTTDLIASLPTRPVRAVLDTDTFNEVDDQFALAHALLSPEAITLEAVYAAPFVNVRAADPAEGMERSYEEIERVLSLLGRRPKGGVFRGSTRWLTGSRGPVESPAAHDLIARAHIPAPPLHVIAIGAPTNIASALRLDPSIAQRIVVVWLGGHGFHWPDTREFNLMQDPDASRTLLESEVPLVLLPCMGVVQMLATTLPELEFHLGRAEGIARFLYERVRDFPDKPDDASCWHKVIWDLAATAWFVNPEWCPSELRPVPRLRDDLTWDHEAQPGKIIRYVREVRRDPVFRDIFNKLLHAAPAP
ncbi:MAG: nucleoside hydrolase [Verrucomicrobia bacterium]|nr:MAG: nucleoside hydrolase [Verrucomicrobiota bacterium]